MGPGVRRDDNNGELSNPHRDRFCSKKFSAVEANTCMLASRSLLPVSSVIARGSRPATAMQLWPAAPPKRLPGGPGAPVSHQPPSAGKKRRDWLPRHLFG